MIGILCSRIRVEEKALFEALRRRAVPFERLDEDRIQFPIGNPFPNAPDVVLDRSIHHGRSLYALTLLNAAGVPQVSPANTYPGLTTSEPGTEKGEPAKYYPTGKRTYLRIVPRDKIQSAALLTQMKQDGCKKTAVATPQNIAPISSATSRSDTTANTTTPVTKIAAGTP